MKILTFIAALVILFAVDAGYCADPLPPTTHSVQSAYEQLLEVKFFAFGGVGYAGSTSHGELAFRAVLARTNALALFSATFSKGTDAAKLYALCGIRRLDKPSFEAAAEILKQGDPTVATMSGCMASSEKASLIIQRISMGTYDVYVNSPIR